MLQLPPSKIPLSLYVHIPWCIRKCPYCDFNSHASPNVIPETEYTDRLLHDLKADIAEYTHSPLKSIFFGGGTPSLFSASAIGRIIDAAQHTIGFDKDIEITLEANPGTVEYTNFSELRKTGVNRLSMGVQSFDSSHLKQLGRIHSTEDTHTAFNKARKAGFDNINIDLMHGLPKQTKSEAFADLKAAFLLDPEHISWYQLTIEPNTVFYNSPPQLPDEDILTDIQDEGELALANAQFLQYEVSAYAKNNRQSAHNLNYWQFGDYLGIGAGAHGKITQQNGIIERYRKTRLPTDYMKTQKATTAGRSIVEPSRLPLEFMMNALRLPAGVPRHYFEQRTGIPITQIQHRLQKLESDDLLKTGDYLAPTALGFRYLNTLLAQFNEASGK